MHQLYDILCHWNNASDEEVAHVKSVLMPEDDIETITFKVTEHPEVTPTGEVYISWFDIDVYNKHVPIGYITINTSEGTIDYVFS